jgi:hypothetical protein
MTRNSAKKQIINILAGSFGYVTFRARSKTYRTPNLSSQLKLKGNQAAENWVGTSIYVITIGESDK